MYSFNDENERENIENAKAKVVIDLNLKHFQLSIIVTFIMCFNDKIYF